MEKNYESAAGSLGRIIPIRLLPGSDVLLGLTEVCRDYGITNGVLVSAIGSLNGVRFCSVDHLPESKAGYGYTGIMQLDGPIELTGASGIICHDADGEPNLHVHITLSDPQGTGYGGHLCEGTKVLLTFDAVLAEISGVSMDRDYDENLEIPLFAPKQA